MLDVVTGAVIAALITAVGALAVGIVNHLKSSSCWGISMDCFPTNNSTNSK